MSGRSKKKAPAVRSRAPASSAGEMPGATDSRSLKSGSRPAGLNDRWWVLGVCLFLAAIIWAVFGQTLHHEFVNYDDPGYVYDNPAVTRGLTLQGIEWAFTHSVRANWHPLTMLSHMLDCRFYGLNAGGHHLTSLLLHTATAVLLFLVLRRMTGFLWRSAFVAAVFAIHPLRVESVAWVSERKDVLSGLFFMLTVGAYGRYVEKSKVQDPRSKVFYGLALVFFALGLMSKPMLVTLPFVLLLLDYWPLNRLRAEAATEPVFRLAGRRVPRRLVFEKLPLLGLAGASGVATIYAQTDALTSFEKFSLSLRVGNALISYVAYLGQMFWPSGLAVLYPIIASGVGISKVVLSLVLLASISAGVFILCRRHPYFLTGWLWYLIMLAPVIGLVQVGAQARADRYTYLPQIGLYLMLTWAAGELWGGWRYRRMVLGGGATVILMALIFCAHAQTSYWRNSESLWTHTLTCTPDNAITHYNLGNALLQMGSVDEAIVQYQKALQIKPDYADAHNNLGNVLFLKGKMDEAITQYQKALQIKPDYAIAHNNLGIALNKTSHVDEAITHFQKALQIKPDFAEAHGNFGDALLQKGNVDEAITQYQKALQITPDDADVLNNLAWLLATCPDAHFRDGVQAVRYAGRACELTYYQKATFIGTLAAAYAEAGRFDDAVATAQKACTLAFESGDQNLLNKNQELVTLYQAHQPYHEVAIQGQMKP